MLRKYEKVKNHVEVLMAEEGEGVSLPETNKREQSTETKEAVRTMKPKKKFIKNVQIGYYCLSQMQKIMEATWLLNAERMQTSMI